MKLVREHINEKFEETSDPVKDMGIGASDRKFQEIMKNADSFNAADKKAARDELINYGFFKTKKEATEILSLLFKYIQKQLWNGAKDIDLARYLVKETDIKKAEKIINYAYLLDKSFLRKLVQILAWQDKEELFNVCLKKYGKAFIHAIKSTGTYISGVGWRDMPDWYNKILAKELQKTNFFDLKRQAIQIKINDLKKELDKISKMENQKTFTPEEAIDMATYFEQYKKHLSDKKIWV